MLYPINFKSKICMSYNTAKELCSYDTNTCKNIIEQINFLENNNNKDTVEIYYDRNKLYDDSKIVFRVIEKYKDGIKIAESSQLFQLIIKYPELIQDLYKESKMAIKRAIKHNLNNKPFYKYIAK